MSNILRILVVDDEHDTTDSMAIILRLLGHAVIVAYKGCEAIEQAKVCNLDFVLLDIGMPEMDGFEVARRLRKESTAILVAVSGFAREQDFRKGREAGIEHYLIKPVDIVQIQAVLTTHLAKIACDCFHFHSYSGLRRVQCEAMDGKLILRGNVQSYFLKQLAQESVAKLDRKASIENWIAVE